MGFSRCEKIGSLKRQILNRALYYYKRCLDRRNWFPPEDPRDCKHGIGRSGACCDKEYCNLNLYPVLLSPEATETPKGINCDKES